MMMMMMMMMMMTKPVAHLHRPSPLSPSAYRPSSDLTLLTSRRAKADLGAWRSV